MREGGRKERGEEREEEGEGGMKGDAMQADRPTHTWVVPAVRADKTCNLKSLCKEQINVHGLHRGIYMCRARCGNKSESTEEAQKKRERKESKKERSEG